jgi:hypothetical protein
VLRAAECAQVWFSWVPLGVAVRNCPHPQRNTDRRSSSAAVCFPTHPCLFALRCVAIPDGFLADRSSQKLHGLGVLVAGDGGVRDRDLSACRGLLSLSLTAAVSCAWGVVRRCGPTSALPPSGSGRCSLRAPVGSLSPALTE